jgi:hypothetical protein
MTPRADIITPRPPLTPRTPRETPFLSPRTALGAVSSYHLKAKNEPQGWPHIGCCTTFFLLLLLAVVVAQFGSYLWVHRVS